MKAGWQSKPIGDVFKVVNGGTPKTGVASNWDGPHAWITPAEMGNLDTPYISESRRTLTDEGLRTGAELVPVGSIILSSRAPIGHLVINEIPMAFNQGCKGLIHSPAIDTKFAYYFLLTNVPLLESLGTGATFKELSGGKLKEVGFQFPDLGEQHRIVTLLDEAFADIATAKANAEKNLQNAREVFETHLKNILNARVTDGIDTTLQKCCDQIFAGGDVPKDRVSSQRTATYPVPIFSNGAKDAGLYGFTDAARVTKPSVTVSARGTLGFSAIRNEPFLPVVRLIVLTPNENLIDLSFLHYTVLGMDFENTGTSIPQLTVPNFKDLSIYLPPLAKQKELVLALDSIRDEIQNLESIYRQKLTALDDLKKSLLHQAFSGQLTQ